MKAVLLALASFAGLCFSVPMAITNRQRAVSADKAFVAGKHVWTAREQSAFPQCDLSRASQPVAPTPLPSPDPSIVLREVVIGRGIQVCPLPDASMLGYLRVPQNYTCSSSSASVTPTTIGAVASLFNASCVAAISPDILSILPRLALQLPYPEPLGRPLAVQQLQPSTFDLSGHHYFITNTTPVFDLSSSNLGFVVAHKAASSNAPVNATKGPNDIGDGAVPWLYLTATAATVGPVKEVFRLNTAGGMPPETCLGMPPTFSVQYAAEYWFYGLP